MKTVTLRNIPPQVARLVQRKAERERISINKAVIRLLEEGLGLWQKKTRPCYHDLDTLAGSWKKAEADDFERTLAEQRALDPELWI